jgi:hypothetical protein
MTDPRTPENTPIPGGGRWRWDETALDWVSLDQQPNEPPNEQHDPSTALPADEVQQER